MSHYYFSTLATNPCLSLNLFKGFHKLDVDTVKDRKIWINIKQIKKFHQIYKSTNIPHVTTSVETLL